jgi:CheY-like chemotaxis protein
MASAMRRAMLESAGYRVLTAQSGDEGIRIFASASCDAVILDYAMPHMNGGAVAAAMRRIDRNIGLILHSGCLEIPDVESALFDRVIPKGASPDVLLSAVQQLLFDVDRKDARPVRSAKGRQDSRSEGSRAGSARHDQNCSVSPIQRWQSWTEWLACLGSTDVK